MSKEEFEYTLNQIDKYTDYIYLHVKGEPLLHNELNQLLDLCDKYEKKVNITTNGTLIKKQLSTLINHNCIRQINFSLHSENNYRHYLKHIFEAAEQLSKEKYIVFRLWTMNNNTLNKKSTEIVEKIIENFNLSTEIVNKINTEKNIKIKNNIFISKENQFIWPDIDNDYYNEIGYCYALKSHIAILVDGTVIPCCLDGEGIINLGNIFELPLEKIIETDKYKKIEEGFKNRKVSENLCKHCSFKSKF